MTVYSLAPLAEVFLRRRKSIFGVSHFVRRLQRMRVVALFFPLAGDTSGELWRAVAIHVVETLNCAFNGGAAREEREGHSILEKYYATRCVIITDFFV